jgi:hypothetical protein
MAAVPSLAIAPSHGLAVHFLENQQTEKGSQFVLDGNTFILQPIELWQSARHNARGCDSNV